MKKNFAVIVSMLLVIALLSLAGCSKDKTASGPASPGDQQVAEKNSGSEGTGGDASELKKLFKSAREVKGLSYEMTSSITGKEGNMTSQGKYFINGQKLRMEMETQGMKSVVISNGSDTYMYTPATNTAIKTPEPEENLADQWAQSDEDLADMKIVGHEKMDGYQCAVITSSAVEEGSVKMWLREDIAMPVRMESGNDNNKIIIQYKNFKIGAQPDSLFELPAGAQIMDMSDMKNLPPMPDMKNMPQVPQ